METLLPDFVLADLYKNSLVIIPNEDKTQSNKQTLVKDKEIHSTKTTDKPIAQKFWLGDNAKHVTIILEDKKNVFVDENVLQFLTNILSACHLNLSDVSIVNIHNKQLNFDEIVNTLHSKYVLMFGIYEAQISLNNNLNLYENKTIANVQVLKCQSFESMMQPTPEAKKEKANLWNCLKKIFGLN